MTDFRAYDRVQHKDGRVGMVERVTPDGKGGTRVSVQFPNHHRTSVIDAKNLTHLDEKTG